MPTYTPGGNDYVAGESNARGVPAVWLTSINPTTHGRDAVQFTLTVDGSGFAAGSVVNFDGNDKTTTVVSPTQVTAPVTLTGGQQPRTAPVVVRSGNGYSSPAPFVVT